MEEKKPTLRKLSLVTLMGLPASGKSTFADTVTSSLNSDSAAKTFCIILRYDDFVPLQVQKQFFCNPSAAKILRRNFLLSVQHLASTILNVNSPENDESSTSSNKSFLIDHLSSLSPSSESSSATTTNQLIENDVFVQKIERTLEDCRDKIEHCDKFFIIIDDNNYYRSMRNELYGIAKTLSCSFCVLYLKTSLSQCLERNSHRSVESQVTSEVIEEMNEKLEEPNPMENTCDLYCVQVNESLAEEDIHLSVKSLLEYSLENPVVYTPPVDRSDDRRICKESEIHQADLVLRKWINRELTMTAFDSANIKSAANRKREWERKNMIKSTILQKLKSGEFKVSADVSQDIEFRKEIISFTTKVTLPPPPSQAQLTEASTSVTNNSTSNVNNVETALDMLKLSTN